MSLRRLLELIISALFLIVFAGTMLISVNNTRAYLQEQMESHAQDTATSLALSLTPAIESGDWPTANSMVDAIFDRGYYLELTIVSVDGGVLLTRSLPVKIETVPQWFVKLIPLETPKGEALLAAGWKQAGRLTVKSHPGYAYGELWRSAVGTFGWFAASWAAAMFIVIAVIRYALAPLKKVEEQALAISAREFPVLEKLPWTRELRSVATAMNSMSGKLKGIIGGQVELIEKVRKEAYHDQVTGLANRRSFEERLRYLLEKKDEFPRGALLLIGLAGLKDYNDRHGLVAGDELLKQAARLIEGAFSGPGEVLIARLGGADFAVLTVVSSMQEAEELGEKMGRELGRLHTRGLTDAPCAGNVGIAYYDSGQQDPFELLSEADMALRSAQQKGANAWHMYEKAAAGRWETHSATGWQRILRDAIDKGGIRLFFQPVVACPDRAPMHYEAFARIAGKNGAWLPAGLFLPMAERLGLAVEIDRVVVRAASGHLRSMPAGETVAVNISPTSVHDPEFADWLCEFIKNSPATSGRMVFESTEYGCSARPESLRGFVDRVRASGGRFSLDRFGAGLDQFGYLRDLKIDYIKIDGSLIRRIHEEKDNQFFVQALAQIAHGLDIKVIAESVETVEEWAALKRLGVDGAQGYFIGEPKAAW